MFVLKDENFNLWFWNCDICMLEDRKIFTSNLVICMNYIYSGKSDSFQSLSDF